MPSLLTDVRLTVSKFTSFTRDDSTGHSRRFVGVILNIAFRTYEEPEKNRHMILELTQLESFGYSPVGALGSLVHSAPIYNEQIFQTIVNGVQTICKYPGSFKWDRQSMTRLAQTCMEAILSMSCKFMQMSLFTNDTERKSLGTRLV